ncbi:MAG: hypothetical protein IJW92_08865 [Clostridia bacterium]|nr:hypothetical protein [Clostridia bacterium]
MEFALPQYGKDAIRLSHFPSRLLAFLFRANEYLSDARVARLLGTTEENVRRVGAEMGLPKRDAEALWLKKGYITVIKRFWHLLPYEQLMELLETDAASFATLLREEDFLDIKLKQKPRCERLCWHELTEEDHAGAKKIAAILSDVSTDGVPPFEFRYDLPEIKFSGKPLFDARIVYPFSGLYLYAFDVDSREYCPDDMLRAYQKIGVNGIWLQAVLYQLTAFPLESSLSKGYEARQARLRELTERCAKFGIKVYLYLNEPRSMPDEFFERYPQYAGHRTADNKTCMCISVPEVKQDLSDRVAALCRAVPLLGGFFTITRSENVTNCYSHSTPQTCLCPRCQKRPVEDVIADVISAIEQGAHSVREDIRVMVWSWAWGDEHLNTIARLPKSVTMLCKSEQDVSFTYGGVTEQIKDYSMSKIGPGEHAKSEWAQAKEHGLHTGAKVQVNTTWESSTVPAIPVYPSIERHMRALNREGIRDILLSWTLGGYPSQNLLHAAKSFYEQVELPPDDPREAAACECFSRAFENFPSQINVQYYGPQNGGPSNLLFLEPTGYPATMTCFAYDDLDSWRGPYSEDTLQEQFELLCRGWEEGLELLKDAPQTETVIMAQASYCLFRASLNQIRFLRARRTNDLFAMRQAVESELEIAQRMLSLMCKNAAIGFEAANHYYFSKSCMTEKVLNCHHILEELDRMEHAPSAQNTHS